MTLHQKSYRHIFISAVVILGFFDAGKTHAQILEWPTETPPPPLLAPEVKFPEYELTKLENGLQVVVVAAREQPVVNVRLLVRAG
jgi:hypothetical protein